MAVFGVLTDGQHHAPVDMRLYLPNRWVEDPARCDQAGVPADARKLTSKSEHARDIVRQARARGMRFEWVGVDAGYGKEPAFLRALDDANEVFVADVHSVQRVWTERPEIYVPPPKTAQHESCRRRRTASRWRASSKRSVLRTGRDAFCATARAAGCVLMSRTGGCGFGIVRNLHLGVGI